MNPLARPRDAAWVEDRQDADAKYICTRVVDTLLREDVRECVSRGEIVRSDALPAALAASFGQDQRWLQITHFGDRRLWIPVSRAGFMQRWRLTRLPLIDVGPAGCHAVHAVGDVLACFRDGLPPDEAHGFIDFETECRTAREHRQASAAEQERWFREWRTQAGNSCGADPAPAHARLLHYDRLAAFQDHPFYPTARAKLGFSVADLALYGPEFQASFELNWLAVPQALYQPSGESLPPNWPGFAGVGLDEALSATHTLVPVHPFVWRHHLDAFLQQSGLAEQVLRAPREALRVVPTLSVRTLALCDAPAWHVKLPLTIRTLGGRNIRTIKPSTIVDGHRIQSLLGAIVAREASLRGRVILTAEDTGAHVANQTFLGFIVRRYPQAALDDASLVPIAALCAPAPAGGSVTDEIVARYFAGDRAAFLDEYLALTLRLHLRLWLRYGIALESNQQNSVLVLSDHAPRLRLLLKDNDAARIRRGELARRWPELASMVGDLLDARIVVDDELPLAQMFTTITLQLNIAALIEAMAPRWQESGATLYGKVRQHLEHALQELEAEGETVGFARQVLLEDEQLYIKYLLVAATLVDKQTTGAADVNKYYGRSAPNFLREAR